MNWVRLQRSSFGAHYYGSLLISVQRDANHNLSVRRDGKFTWGLAIWSLRTCRGLRAGWLGFNS